MSTNKNGKELLYSNEVTWIKVSLMCNKIQESFTISFSKRKEVLQKVLFQVKVKSHCNSLSFGELLQSSFQDRMDKIPKSWHMFKNVNCLLSLKFPKLSRKFVFL